MTGALGAALEVAMADKGTLDGPEEYDADDDDTAAAENGSRPPSASSKRALVAAVTGAAENTTRENNSGRHESELMNQARACAGTLLVKEQQPNSAVPAGRDPVLVDRPYIAECSAAEE